MIYVSFQNWGMATSFVGVLVWFHALMNVVEVVVVLKRGGGGGTMMRMSSMNMSEKKRKKKEKEITEEQEILHLPSSTIGQWIFQSSNIHPIPREKMTMMKKKQYYRHYLLHYNGVHVMECVHCQIFPLKGNVGGGSFGEDLTQNNNNIIINNNNVNNNNNNNAKNRSKEGLLLDDTSQMAF